MVLSQWRTVAAAVALTSASVDVAQPTSARLAAAQCPAGAAEPRPVGAFGQGGRMRDPYAGKPKILFVADTHTGNQNAHDGISHAMAQLEHAVRAAGMVLYLRTDTEWITKDEVWGTGDYAKGCKKQARGRNLNDFAAVVFYINGETDMTPKQKADLLSWIKSGKGFVGIHTATSAGYYWPEYGDMIGGYFDNHPWGITTARIRVEHPDFPGMQGYVANPLVYDEHYSYLPPYSRDKVDVLASIDTRSVDMKNPEVHRKDGDFPVAWIKSYGAGRVFYSDLGHPDAAWDDPRMLNMYVGAIKWAAGLASYPIRPHAQPKP